MSFAVVPLLMSLLAVGGIAFLRWRERGQPVADELGTLCARLPGIVYRCRPDGSFLAVSTSARELLGIAAEDLVEEGRSLLDLAHPADRASLLRELDSARLEDRPFQAIYRLALPGGERWVWDRGSFAPGEDGTPAALEGFMVDITDRKNASDQALFEVLHDPLTGLANRALLSERIGFALRRLSRHPEPHAALLWIEIDRFPAVQGSLGRRPGEIALRALAERLEGALRQEDTVARLGNHHFGVLLESLDSEDGAERIARRLSQRVESALLLEGEEVVLTASIGVVPSLVAYDAADEALRDAEIAAQRAREQGGGRQRLYDPGLHLEAVEQLRLETDLRRAILDEDLVLLYQPVVSLLDGTVRGFEALLRWRHPERGILAPSAFLGTALETGLIVPISWWALREACSQLRRWQDLGFGANGELYVAVNLTSEQLLLPDLASRIAAILAETLLPASGLRIEITENLVMSQAELAAASLLRLREMGIKISLDDFGTGYSSLASLRQLPIAGLKIDRSFIHNLESRSTSEEIVRAILAMARSLDLEVVAEGVERPEQVNRLLGLRCHEAQGFLFGRPMPATAASELLRGDGSLPAASELLFA